MPPPSPAAREVLHELREFATRHPDAPAVVIAWYLAARFCPARLRKKYQPGRGQAN